MLARVDAAPCRLFEQAIGERLATGEITRVERREPVPEQTFWLVDDPAGRNEALEDRLAELQGPGDLPVPQGDHRHSLSSVRKADGVGRLHEPNEIVGAGELTRERRALGQETSERDVVTGVAGDSLALVQKAQHLAVVR